MKNESSSRNYRYFGLQRKSRAALLLKENPHQRDIVLERRQVVAPPQKPAPTEFSALLHTIRLFSTATNYNFYSIIRCTTVILLRCKNVQSNGAVGQS